MLINYLVIILIGFLLSQVLIHLFKRLALKFNVFAPGNIPRIGGIAMGLGFVIVCLFVSLFSGKVSKEIIGIITTSMIMIVFGIIDDWRELSIMTKFLVQIIVTSLLILFGIRTQIIYIENLLNIIITFFWVIGIANAFNHLDIIDGLAAGTAGIVSLAFFTISLLTQDTGIAILSLTLAATVFSFLIYNLPPAKIYMGNCGSHFLGFVLAAIALAISYAPLERKVALASPLLILGLPIFDTAFLILMRKRQRRSIFKKSNDHLALRFIKLGYSKIKTLGFMLFLCLFFCLCGILVSQLSNLFGIAIITSVVLVSFALTKRMGKVQFND